MNFGDRHTGDLSGRLRTIAETRQLDVAINVAPMHAALASVQHTAWMLINLLARMQHIVGSVRVNAPSVRQAGRVVPFATRRSTLQDALVEGGTSIGVVPVIGGSNADLTFNIGPEQPGMSVYGNAWTGGISTTPIAAARESSLPIGPYLAACLAASEAFRHARFKAYTPTTGSFYTAWQHRTRTTPTWDGPTALPTLEIDAVLAGVGAVGSTVLHVLWTLESTGIVRAADFDLIDGTNLNRCPIFDARGIGQAKTLYATQVLQESTVTILPHDGSWERFVPDVLDQTIVLSAVDKNAVRAGIQDQYFPRLLQASTADLRAEVFRAIPGSGPCLRCYSPPEPRLTDETLRATLAADPTRIAATSAATGIDEREILSWAQNGACGTTSAALLPLLQRTAVEPRQFSVGFVSVAAGTLLAAELLKTTLGAATPLNAGFPRAVLQFFSPESTGNGAVRYARDPQCPKCDPHSIAAQYWRQRARAS